METLLRIQQELSVPKDQYNDFAGFKYRSCEDILEAVKPLLKDLNAILTLNDEVVNIGDKNYVKATATLKVGEETFETTAFAREPESKKGMDASQITGASSSYARKYALNGLFAIDDGKDADSFDNREQTQTKSKKTSAKKLTMAQGKYLKDLGYKGDIENMTFEEASAKITELKGGN